MTHSKIRIILVLTILATLTLLFSSCEPAEEEGTIRIGQITNRTGDTSDVGIPLADGARDAWNWINNELGGVRGRPVRLIEREAGYNEIGRASCRERVGSRWGAGPAT